MLIHSLDQGRRCGIAIGTAGERPRSGFATLRKEKEHEAIGYGNLIAYLQETWRRGAARPDLVVFEEAMNVGAWYALCQRLGRPQSSASIQQAHSYAGVIMGVCNRFEVPFLAVSRKTILSHMTKSTKHGGREQAKAAVIAACKARGLVDHACEDDDRCDAIAQFVWASETIAKRPVGNFAFYGQKPY